MQAKERLKHIIKNDQTCQNKDFYHSARQDVQLWLEREEIMWKKQSRSIWFKEGDHNTKFFHTRTSHRRQKNTISRLKDEVEDWKEGEDLVLVVKEHFNAPFSTPCHRGAADFLDLLGG